ncbi:hypothetical protein, partial [Neorhizobium alkalisoli]|uniref:hypothetical protein n=1 Tax=Neorhizobium alkalisoli TaxID=528178 RepID=UPI00197CAAA6
PPEPNRNPAHNQHSPILKDSTRTKDFVASSAAALVSEAVYRSTPINKSTAVFKKMSFFFGKPETPAFPSTI